MGGFLEYFRKSGAAEEKTAPQEQQGLYKKLRFRVFLAGTLGYSLYYVCRTTLNVVKKPMIDEGVLDATQLGLVGSALLFAYAIGKFVNGFLADHSNIKRLMATGLIVSAAANFIMGILGFARGVVPATAVLVIFMILWGINGWSQSVGSPCAIVGLSRWFPLKQRGTYYGFFSASHNIGEFLSFLFVGLIVSTIGWQWGFFGSAMAGVLGVVVILVLMSDTPESKGLPPVEELAGEKKPETSQSTKETQKQVLRTPAVWVLAAASAFMYMSRYAVNGWGVLFLQEVKGFDLAAATSIISVNALLGILGTVLSGWMSDKLFRGNRNIPALLSGILLSMSLALFLFGGNGFFVNILSMVLFGIAIGVLICFLGGLMAVDIVPRNASGAALGVVGIASYVAAGIQDIISGILIDSRATIVDGVTHYDFSAAAYFWLGASIISFTLPIINWKKKSGGIIEQP